MGNFTSILTFDRLPQLARSELTRLKAGKGYFRLVSGGMKNRVCRWIGLSQQEQIVFKSMRNFAADESGAAAIEYALIASLIAVFIITAVSTVGAKVGTVLTEIGNTLK